MPNANGISDIVIAAICGNMWYESTINPAIWESLSSGTWTDLLKGYGLGQWTNTGGDTHGRLYKLHEYLSTNGLSDDDGDGQLSYIPIEDYWVSNSSYPQFQNLTSFLNSNDTNITTLTHAWNICWEGIHDATWDARVIAAQKCLDYIRAHSTEEKTWIKGNRYLAESERLNNCILVYQGLGGRITRKKHMPVYMMVRKQR